MPISVFSAKLKKVQGHQKLVTPAHRARIMGSVALTKEGTEEARGRKPIGAFKSSVALAILWLVNLLVILFGWPFLLYGKLKYRKSDQFD